MEGLYAPSSPAPIILAARRSPHVTRAQQIFADARADHVSTQQKVYVEVTPPTGHVWQAIEPSSFSAPAASLRVQYRDRDHDRMEAWDASTPSTQSFPHHLQTSPSTRQRRPRRSPSSKRNTTLRRELSHHILQAYDVARAPFRMTHRRSRTHDSHMPYRLQGQRPSVAKGESPGTIAHCTVEITGPLTTSNINGLHDTLANKLFRQKSQRSLLTSPLSLYAPVLASAASLDELTRPQTSEGQASRQQRINNLRLRNRNRDSFARAKIHIRRPPKGCTHWFEALDEELTDDEFSDAHETPPAMSAPAHVTTFQPSLGPHRARAAPTTFVSQPMDCESDYFSYSQDPQSNRCLKNSSSILDVRNPSRLIVAGRHDPNNRSVLDLSSDNEEVEEEEEEETLGSPPVTWEVAPSPSMRNPAAYHRRRSMYRKGSTANVATPGYRQSMARPGYRQSMASMQTTLTSGTIPFMMRVSSVINDGATPPVPTLARHAAAYFALTGRPPTADERSVYTPSIRESGTASLMSAGPSASAHYVALNSEEMALIETMRRNRAAQQDSSLSYSSPVMDQRIREEDEESVPIPVPLQLPPRHDMFDEEETPRSQSVGSVVTLESGESVTFPHPPPAKKSSLSERIKSRTGSNTLFLEDLPTPAPTLPSYWSPEEESPANGPSTELEGCRYTRSLPLKDSTVNPLAVSPRRNSSLSLLRPRVFGGPISPPIDSAVPYMYRSVEERRPSLLKSALMPQPQPRSIDNDLHMDFAGLDFGPVRNLLSPSYGGLISSTAPPEDYLSAGGAAAAGCALSPNESPGYDPRDDDDDDDDDDDLTPATTCDSSPGYSAASGSRSPSLTDGASMSGNSRSEFDTPTREADIMPRIVSFGERSSAASARGDDEGQQMRQGRRAATRLSDQMAELVGGVKGIDFAEKRTRHGRAHDEGIGRRQGSELSVEVMEAWSALGGTTRFI